MNVLLWAVVPYVCLAVFVLGHLWRRRYPETWTTRSSQLLESRILRLASPLFHVGILGVAGGHVLGILVPARATAAIGISDHVYHVVALVAGGTTGTAALAGIVLLVARRLLVPRVRAASRATDVAVGVALLVVIGLGMGQTFGWNLGVGEYDYRATVSPWFRHLVTLRPEPSLMAGVPWVFQAHVLAAFALFALWPFSRLVHVWSVPLAYVRRAHILYRARRAPAPARGFGARAR